MRDKKWLLAFSTGVRFSSNGSRGVSLSCSRSFSFARTPDEEPCGQFIPAVGGREKKPWRDLTLGFKTHSQGSSRSIYYVYLFTVACARGPVLAMKPLGNSRKVRTWCWLPGESFLPSRIVRPRSKGARICTSLGGGESSRKLNPSLQCSKWWFNHTTVVGLSPGWTTGWSTRLRSEANPMRTDTHSK